METKVYPAIEREATSIPLREILSPDNTPNFFPEVKSKAFFDIDYRGDELILVAGKYIGLIPLNEQVAINVQPKIGVSSLVHIISKSREYLDSLHFFEKFYKETSSTSPTIFEFFAKCLSVELRKVEREGVFKKYTCTQSNLPSPKGKINIGRTISHNWSRGSYFRVHCDYFEFTADNHYNRLVKYTLWYCLNHLLRIRSTNSDLIKELSYYYSYFESIPLDKKRSFLEPVLNDIHNQKIPILRKYYENLCKVCRCIIEDIGIMLRDPGEDIKMLSFIINMESVFEKYLLYILREKESFLGSDAKVLDGNKEAKKYLFNDTRKYEAKPDIVVKYNGECRLIIDAKYKKKISETDRYQIISHAISYGVKKVLLILPYSGQPQKGLVRIGEIGTGYFVELFEYYIDLESDDLLSVESAYCHHVRDLIAT